MKRVANFEAVDGVWFQIKMMELSNAVGRYLSSAARQRELLGGHTYLMQVQVLERKRRGAVNCLLLGWRVVSGGCTPHE